VTAADTSVVVAAFASWHRDHEDARAALARNPSIPVQAALEAYSVLTRMPAPHRAPPEIVRDFIVTQFGDALLQLSPARFAAVLDDMTRLGIVGGAAYDALIAATAQDADHVLLTLDRRARQTYERLGVSVEYLG
jgi:predicted nucleic acid-binding protein